MCMYICTYPSASYIHTISISISTYLPTKPSSIDYRFLSPPPLPVPRACAYVCVYSVYIYELIEGFSSLSCSAPKKKKRNVRFGGFAPSPLPCDGSSHIQSQLDKTRQATCLPACKKIKKKIRNPHPTMSRC